MVKIYLTTLSIILLSLTIVVSVIRPKMDKPVQLSVNEIQVVTSKVSQDSISTNQVSENIKIVNQDNSNVKTVDKVVNTDSPKSTQATKVVETKSNIVTKTVQVESNQQKPKSSTKIVDTKTQNSITLDVEENHVQPKIETSEKVVQLPSSVKEIIKEVNTPKTEDKNINIDMTPKNDVKVQEKVVVLPKVESKPIEQMTPDEIIKQAEKEDRLLNEREEIVVWNVWRSNLQNQIMQDTQVSAPLGTVFKFSFTVDKKGRISNLRTWAQPSMYNSVAINYLKPLIQNYQGKPILNFPSRTKRVITNVTGGFTISTEDKFSTPNDFSDIERIRTTR